MNNIKAVIIGVFIWILGVSFFMASYFFPFMEDQELQANLILAISMIPNAYLGAYLFYRKGSLFSGIRLAFTVVFIAIVLDALITVPYFILPYGGSYEGFFGAPAFWLIVLEYFLVVFSYWNFRVRTQTARF
ncbi:MAG: DUF5367 family protein [Bacteroidota bacterium]